MSETEFKKYDSDDNYVNYSARLTKDAEVREGDKVRVKLTFVSQSRNENHHDIWITADVNDGQAPLARYLKKGDVIGIEGKPYLWGDANPQFALNFARIHIGNLIKTLKERGFTPGAASSSGKPAAKKTNAKKGPRKIELPEDDEPTDNTDE